MNADKLQDGAASDGQAPKLSEEDLERVRRVTSTGIHAVERKPFRPGRLLLIIVASIVIMGQMSILIAEYYLPQ